MESIDTVLRLNDFFYANQMRKKRKKGRDLKSPWGSMLLIAVLAVNWS